VGQRLRATKAAAEAFRREFSATGTPTYAESFALSSIPYPTQFGLWRASDIKAEFMNFKIRMFVAQWTERGGRTRTLLFDASDGVLDSNTPYFADLFTSRPKEEVRRIVKVHHTVLEHLEAAGIAPEDVDYIAYDHLHTQDVRRWLGTTRPQADISPDAPVTATFPNAKLIVQRSEWASLADLHPFQQPWYQPTTYVDVPSEKIIAIDGDVLLGPGVALLLTPGHAAGNMSLCLNTDTGIWTFSENAVAAEMVTPEHSEIPGVAAWAQQWHQEVVINANTIESAADQYNSLVLEKYLADFSVVDGRFRQFFPTAELIAMLPGAPEPTFMHEHLRHGSVQGRS
jgi:glyoxylase-like metal-dependent hydrolase (beta-lactamase superfamily II)